MTVIVSSTKVKKNNQHSAKTNYYRIPPAKCNALSSVILGSEQKQSNQTGYLNEKSQDLNFAGTKKIQLVSGTGLPRL